MIAPLLLGTSQTPAFADDHATHLAQTAAVGAASVAASPDVWALGIGVHTAVMLLTMMVVAWIVYRKLGLAVLRQGWINFDLIWAAALLVVGSLALLAAL
ncbi:MAG: hypothetical protein M5U01_29490 [Ardenticatenaceae bacterium]|nr:hypothetical protein [Ardenticatenaceae bacterium]